MRVRWLSTFTILKLLISRLARTGNYSLRLSALAEQRTKARAAIYIL